MRNINELIGIIKAIDFDGIINQQEIDFLREWVNNNRNLAYDPKQRALIKLVDEVIDDNVVTDAERRKLEAACMRIQKDGLKETDRINELLGIIEGIISDGEINEPEVRKLAQWVKENKKFLTNNQEVKVLSDVLEQILEDNIVSDTEKNFLLNFLNDTIEERKLQAKLDYLTKKVTLKKNIGMDLLDLFNNEKQIASIHRIAEKKLLEVLKSDANYSSDAPIIFISLILIAMLYYDGNFYDNAALVYKDTYQTYPKQKVDGKIRKIIDRFCTTEDRSDTCRTYVGKILENAVVPNNYLKAFFDFIYDIYKTNLNYNLSLDPMEDFIFVYNGIRKKLQTVGDTDRLTFTQRNSSHKVYKLIKSTQNLILDREEKIKPVIKLSILIANIIDKFIWGKELNIVNPYLKKGFEEWSKTFEKEAHVEREQGDFRSRWEPKLILEKKQIWLVPPYHRIPGEYNDYQTTTIEVLNGKEVIYRTTSPSIYDIFGGYEIRPEKIKVDKPLGKLVYRLKIDSQVKYNSGSKLHKDFLVFNMEGKELKNNTDYSGNIIICSYDEVLKKKAYHIGANYSLVQELVECGNIITIGNRNFTFSAMVQPGIWGEKLHHHYLVAENAKEKIPVYRIVKYVAFECEADNAKAEFISITINGKRNRLSELKPRILNGKGKKRFIVTLDMVTPGVHSIAVERMGERISKIMKPMWFAIDPSLETSIDQLNDEDYSVNIRSSFLPSEITKTISAGSFCLDWLQVRYDNISYAYLIPFEFRFYRLPNKEWRPDTTPLWVDEFSDSDYIEFCGTTAQGSVILANSFHEPRTLDEREEITTIIPIGYLKTLKNDVDQSTLILLRGSEGYRGVHCFNRCKINNLATDYSFDAYNNELLITPFYDGKGQVTCRMTDDYGNILLSVVIENGRIYRVKKIKAFSKYTISYFEKGRGFIKKERLMETHDKQFYTLDSLVGRCFKVTKVHYLGDYLGKPKTETKELENTYINIVQRFKDKSYKGLIFKTDTYGRNSMKHINPVEVELCGDMLNDNIEAVITCDGKPLVVDSFGLVDGFKYKGHKAQCFDIKLTESYKVR